ncbi:hypothetical protein AAY473_004644 [Plecturocebus cupreus]
MGTEWPIRRCRWRVSSPSSEGLVNPDQALQTPPGLGASRDPSFPGPGGLVHLNWAALGVGHWPPLHTLPACRWAPCSGLQPQAMVQGTLEPDGPLWGWDWDGDNDWDGAVLALLALAVVAATALALHWFGSGSDQEVARPASTALGAQAHQAGRAEPALQPKPKVSDGSEGQSPGQGQPEPPGRGQQSPVPAAVPGGGLAAMAALPLRTAGEEARRGAPGQQRGSAIPVGPRAEGREPPAPGNAFLGRSEAGGTSAPLLIHFTPRSPGSDAEAGGEKAHFRQAAGPAGQQDTGPWQAGAGPSGSLGRGRGRRRRMDAGLGDRARRPRTLDQLRLGAAGSVWDAVDEAAALDAHARGLPTGSPLAREPAARAPQPGSLTEGSGVPAPGGGWPWARREVPGTRSSRPAPGSTRPWLESPPQGLSFSSQGPGATGAHAAGEAGAHGSRDHSRATDLGPMAAVRCDRASSRSREPRPPSASPPAAPGPGILCPWGLPRVLLREKISERRQPQVQPQPKS